VCFLVPNTSGSIRGPSVQNNRANEQETDRDTDEIQSESDSVVPLTRANLTGFWYNQHGSELYFEQSEDGSLLGEFRTNVETSPGIAGDTFSIVKGTTSGNLVTFHVAYRGGRSIATWTGQFHTQCDRNSIFYKPSQSNSVLHTTWLLTTGVDSCDDHWMQTRIGQDVFTRRGLKHGPRKNKGTHVPTNRA